MNPFPPSLANTKFETIWLGEHVTMGSFEGTLYRYDIHRQTLEANALDDLLPRDQFGHKFRIFILDQDHVIVQSTAGIHLVKLGSTPSILWRSTLASPVYQTGPFDQYWLKVGGDTAALGRKEHTIVLHRDPDHQWHEETLLEDTDAFAADNNQLVTMKRHDVAYWAAPEKFDFVTYQRSDKGWEQTASTSWNTYPMRPPSGTLWENTLVTSGSFTDGKPSFDIYRREAAKWHWVERHDIKHNNPGSLGLQLASGMLAVQTVDNRRKRYQYGRRIGDIILYQPDKTGLWKEMLRFTDFDGWRFAFNGSHLLYPDGTQWKLVSLAQTLAEVCAKFAANYTPNNLDGQKVLWSLREKSGKRHFLSQLPPSSGHPYGLLTKHKRRWRWFEGGEQNLLDTVSDEHRSELQAAFQKSTAPDPLP